MTIQVTKEDIENGHKRNPDCCPVARALRRNGVAHFGVMLTTVLVDDRRGHQIGLSLSGAVQRWILDFDRSRPVEPMSFELPLPDEETHSLPKFRLEGDRWPTARCVRHGFRFPTLQCGSRFRQSLP